MQTVEIHIPPCDLPEQMAAMRSWLDEHHVEATTFLCDETGSDMRVCVSFGPAAAATAFAARFAGRLRQVAAKAVLDQEALSPAVMVG